MSAHERSAGQYADRLAAARQRAAAIANSGAYREFVEEVRAKSSWRFNGTAGLQRYLHGVDHHLSHFIPRLLGSMDDRVQSVFDFGCGSGAGSIALAMIFPEIHCRGTDINPTEVAIAQARARLYGVVDRCRFESLGEGQVLPVPGDRFDLCICCSVLEYVTDPAIRRTCVQEMARVIVPGGQLFMSVPNRLYPVEIHSGKWGWNYFPRLMKARIVGSHVWEIRHLAHPHVLKLHRTPISQLFTPWTNFCLEKEESTQI